MKEYPVEIHESEIDTLYYVILFVLLICLILIRVYFAKQKNKKNRDLTQIEIEEIADRGYFMLVESLQMMTLLYEEQKKLLPDFVDTLFEVVDDFDNAYRLLPTLTKTGRITQEQLDALEELNKLAGQIDWLAIYTIDESEMTNYPIWAALRNEAKMILQTLGEPEQPPTGNGKIYVTGGSD